MYENLVTQGGLSLDRLRNFCLIADAGGISKAAGGNPAKQSLFSRQIRELEEFFGVELTKRQGKGIVLTEAGRNLARLVREQLQALSDFQHTCRNEPVELRIAASNSILEWLVVPNLGAIQETLPGVYLDLVNLRTEDVVRGLTDMTVDLGIIRRDALPKRLKGSALGTVRYALFVPRDRATRSKDLPSLFAQLRIATSKGRMFRRSLQEAAAKADVALHVDLSCSSFTQAARAASNGKYAAILPSIARADLPESKFTQIELPFLKNHQRPLVLAWNPRMASVRPVIEKAISVAAATFRISP